MGLCPSLRSLLPQGDAGSSLEAFQGLVKSACVCLYMCIHCSTHTSPLKVRQWPGHHFAKVPFGLRSHDSRPCPRGWACPGPGPSASPSSRRGASILEQWGGAPWGGGGDGRASRDKQMDEKARIKEKAHGTQISVPRPLRSHHVVLVLLLLTSASVPGVGSSNPSTAEAQTSGGNSLEEVGAGWWHMDPGHHHSESAAP